MNFRFPLTASYYAEQMFARGYRFTDGEREARDAGELQELFVAHGANEVSARIGTSRHRPPLYDDDTSLDAGVEYARLAARLGLPFNPLLFLSRDYGDETGQPHPVFNGFDELHPDRPWETLTIDAMADRLQRFAQLAAVSILETGASVSVWNLGNEIDLGVAGVAPPPILMEQWEQVDGEADWYRVPEAVDSAIGTVVIDDLLRWPAEDRTRWLEKHVWPHEARLLSAAADGIRTVDPGARFSTHIGFEPPARGTAVAFYRAMRRHGFAVDQAGLSVYPTIHPNSDEVLAAQKGEIRDLMDELGVPVMINEFAYPAASTERAFGDWKHALTGYPATDAGQAAFFDDLVTWGISEGLAGISPWAPDLVDPIWEAMSFFRLEGDVAVARPILRAFDAGKPRAG